MADADFSQDWAQELDRQVTSGRLSSDVVTLSELMSIYQVPGVSIAVGRVNGQVWATGYGVAGGEMPLPVTVGTAFQACSISKHVAAFGALRLVANGVLDLDTDIGDYLTSWIPGRPKRSVHSRRRPERTNFSSPVSMPGTVAVTGEAQSHYPL